MYLYGAGGHAKVVQDILEAQGINISGFIDDNSSLSNYMGLPVKHRVVAGQEIIVCIGNNKVRKQIVDDLRLKKVSFSRGIHPLSVISPRARIGEGTVVMPGGIINSNAQIGNHCIINTSASVDHDCYIEDYVHISPHATLCGNVKVGEGTWIGAGTVIIPGVKIGKWCVIGAGAVVLHDIPDEAVAFGNPAKCRE